MVSKKKQQSGFVLLLTLVIISVILAVGLSLMHITVKQLSLSNIARESEIALHAADSGLECLQFYRNLPAGRTYFLNEDDDPSTDAPTLACGDALPNQADTNHIFDGSRSQYTYNYRYEFDLASGQCAEVSLYLADARTATADIDIPIDEGLTEIMCEQGNLCTTIFSRGYNKSCAERNNIFTVQRELTIEY